MIRPGLGGRAVETGRCDGDRLDDKRRMIEDDQARPRGPGRQMRGLDVRGRMIGRLGPAWGAGPWRWGACLRDGDRGWLGPAVRAGPGRRDRGWLGPAVRAGPGRRDRGWLGPAVRAGPGRRDRGWLGPAVRAGPGRRDRGWLGPAVRAGPSDGGRVFRRPMSCD